MKQFIFALFVLAVLIGSTSVRAEEDEKKAKEAERRAAVQKARDDRAAKLKEDRENKNKPADPKVAEDKSKMAEKAKSEKSMMDEKMAKEKSQADAMMAEREKKLKEDAYPDGTKATLSGKMAIKATGAKAEVVCRLLSTGGGKLDRTYNLVATGEIATKIEAIRQNGDPISVTGTVYGDDINVEKIN